VKEQEIVKKYSLLLKTNRIQEVGSTSLMNNVFSKIVLKCRHTERLDIKREVLLIVEAGTGSTSTW
jgi:hypothetical protein